jgi:hypothetical protein
MIVKNTRGDGLLPETMIWLARPTEHIEQEVLKVSGSRLPHPPKPNNAPKYNPRPQHNRHRHHPHTRYPQQRRTPWNQHPHPQQHPRLPQPQPPPSAPHHHHTTPPHTTTHHLPHAAHRSLLLQDVSAQLQHPPPPYNTHAPPLTTNLTAAEITQLRHFLTTSTTSQTPMTRQVSSVNHPASAQLAWALGLHPHVQGLPNYAQ